MTLKDVTDGPGIRVRNYYTDENPDEVRLLHIELDDEARELLSFVKDFRRTTQYWNGYSTGTAFSDLEERVKMLQSQLEEFRVLNETNPAVRAAWEHYQTMVALAQEHKDET